MSNRARPMQVWFSRASIGLMRLLAPLPLPLLRALGWVLGWLLYGLAGSRRHVVKTNLALCFPLLSEAWRLRTAHQTFVYFAQAWLDRSWLWHGSEALLRRRLSLGGDLTQLQGLQPTVIFSPHFVGLDAGWTALTLQLPRRFTTIYTDQANKTVDAWILAGRQRFGGARLFGRAEGVKPIITALREGQPLYLLPDMNFGPEESVLVPFFGVAAATVPSLSRFARLASAREPARVVPVLTRMTRTGYQVDVLPAWDDVPSDDALADTARMNLRLQDYIETMPAQYYWVHRRFKDRPPGEAPVY